MPVNATPIDEGRSGRARMVCTYLQPIYCHRYSHVECHKVSEGMMHASERPTGDPLSLSYPPFLRPQGSVPLLLPRGH